MSALILAAPGWRVCIWSREQGAVVALPIVAWERETYSMGGSGEHPERTRLRPYVLTEFGEQVDPLDDDAWFVGIMPPGSELYDYHDAGESVAKAYERAEELEEQRLALPDSVRPE